MNHTRTAPRAGFTLVELLMVITIIGLLAALVLAGVMGALGAAKEGSVVAEINQLAQALEAYKEDHLAYPPSMGSLSDTDAPSSYPFFEKQPAREARFMRHLAKAFSKFRQAYIQSGTTFTPESLTYPSVRNQLFQATATDPKKPTGIGANLDNLDAAESLVFWLGGLPDWSSERIVSGFASDRKNPFWKPGDSNIPQGEQREAPYFEFDPSRLVDRDNDGWPEYIPQGTAGTGEMAPYVYFDANSFRRGAHYPNFAGYSEPTQILPKARLRADEWGVAVPYHRWSTNPNLNLKDNPTVLLADIPWVNEKDYQIIAAGADGQYSDTNNTAIDDLTILTIYRYFPFPVGQYGYEYDFDADNLSNFSIKRIGEAELKVQP